MKKVLSLVCVLALTLSCLLALTSCFGGTPNSDPKAAKAALEGNDYSVNDMTFMYTYMDGIKTVLVATLVEDNTDWEDIENWEDLEDIDVDAEAVTIFYFDSEEKATAAYEAVQKVAGEVDNFEQSGAMVYYGTSAGIKAAS